MISAKDRWSLVVSAGLCCSCDFKFSKDDKIHYILSQTLDMSAPVPPAMYYYKLQLKSEPKAQIKISCFGMFSKNCNYLGQFCTDLHRN
jgi:hypothetical protein